MTATWKTIIKQFFNATAEMTKCLWCTGIGKLENVEANELSYLI